MKKRLLIITTRYPLPAVGGDKLRIYEIAKYLFREFDIELISLTDSKQTKLIDDPIFSKTTIIYQSRIKSILNCFISIFFSRLPLQIAYYRNKKFEALALEKSHNADLVIAHLIRTYSAITKIQANIVFELTDALSLNYSRLNSTEYFNIMHWVFKYEIKKLKALEKKICESYENIVFVSKIDANYLSFQNQKNITISPIGVQQSSYNKIAINNESNYILFIGNIISQQNADAVRFFAYEIMPLILLKRNLKFRIIGKINPRFAKELNKLGYVEITGQYNDINQWTSGSFVGVCPVRFGAGMQFKILEYAMLGLTIVSSTNSSLPYENLLINIADDKYEFAKSVIDIYDDRMNRNQDIEYNRNVAIESYNWEKSLENYPR